MNIDKFFIQDYVNFYFFVMNFTPIVVVVHNRRKMADHWKPVTEKRKLNAI